LGTGAWRGATAENSFDRFMDLSRQLTGQTMLDPIVGRLFYDALAQSEHAGALARLLAEGKVDDDQAGALEEQIVLQWFTGIYRSGAATRTATYEGALMWSAMAVPGPPGFCHGGLGFWSQPEG
jgi:hypothetical protein